MKHYLYAIIIVFLLAMSTLRSDITTLEGAIEVIKHLDDLKEHNALNVHSADNAAALNELKNYILNDDSLTQEEIEILLEKIADLETESTAEESATETRKKLKSKRFACLLARNLTVCNNTVLNNLVVNGSFDICGVPACSLINLKATGTSVDIPNTLVMRDNTGSFAATTITLTGVLALQGTNGNTVDLQACPATTNYTLILPCDPGSAGQVLATTGSNPDQTFWTPVTAIVTSTIQLYGDVIGSTSATHVAFVCGIPACALAQTYSVVLSATSCDIPSTLVLRDSTGSFAATTITLNGNSLINFSGLGMCDTGSGYIWAPTNNNTIIGLFAGNSNTLGGTNNVVLGNSALAADTSGSRNVAIGTFALQNNLTGNANTAIGFNALMTNTIGNNNTAIGLNALSSYNPTVHLTGYQHVAIGANAMQNATPPDTFSGPDLAIGSNALQNDQGGDNVAIGDNALQSNMTGYYNVAIGNAALAFNNSGTNNMVIGAHAGQNILTGINNIYVGNFVQEPSSIDESSAIRIGIQGTQTAAYMAGIYGNSQPTGSPVVVLPNGLLGVGSGSSPTLTGTSCDTPLTLVLRDSTGSFAATTITLTGNSLINYSFLGSCDTGQGFVFAPTNQNTIIGLNAGNNNTLTGTSNIALGLNALKSITTGLDNIAIGVNALSRTHLDNDNIAIGVDALQSLRGSGKEPASRNVAVGSQAMQNVTIVTNDIAIGYQALQNDRGGNNIAIGSMALNVNTNGSDNVAIGYDALANSNVSDLTAVGAFALTNNTGGIQNTALGFSTLLTNINGGSNTAVGYNALYFNEGSNNTAVGVEALQNALTISNDIAIGYQALLHDNGGNNVALGNTALLLNNAGSGNTAIGNNVLANNISGGLNTAVGYNALAGNDGNNNIAVGAEALQNATAISNDIAIGYQALLNDNGGNNVALGNSALVLNNSGAENTAIGNQVLSANALGGQNTVIGYNALANNEGDANTIIGSNAGLTLTTGSNNIYVGASVDAASSSENNTIRIGTRRETATYIAGIYNTLLDGQPVVVTSSGQLGVGSTSDLINSATSCDYPLTLVLRDSTGSFSATMITLTGNTMVSYGTSPCDPMGFIFAPTNQNTLIGLQAGNNNTLTGTSNVALGFNALANVVSGYDNIAIGLNALASSQTDAANIAIGTQAMGNTNNAGNASDNIAIGYQTMLNNTGAGNIALGPLALNQGSGSNNIAMGALALGSDISGSFNIGIGNATLFINATGSSNTALGHQADVNSSNAQNRTALGFGTVAPFDNSVALGNSSVTSVVPTNYKTVDLGVAQTNVWATLHTATVRFYDSSSPNNLNASFSTPANLDYSYDMLLPVNQGQAFQVLSTDGNNPAQLSWITTLTNSTQLNLLYTATSSDIPLTLVLRDVNGSFAANYITADGCLIVNDLTPAPAGQICGSTSALIVAPQGTRALQTTANGNVRGTNAVDLQMIRTLATQVASGNYAVVAGGDSNTASSSYATVGGGQLNTSSNTFAVISGGQSNTSSGNLSSVLGGYGNTASGTGSVVVGGGYDGTLTFPNGAPGNAAFIGGGLRNSAAGNSAFIGGGYYNQNASGDFAVIGGGYNNTASAIAATVAGGSSGVANGMGSFIGGGGYDGITTAGNNAQGAASFIGGGLNNKNTSGGYASIAGGQNNTVSSDHTVIVGGASNTVSANYSVIAGGISNNVSAAAATVVGGSSNTASGAGAFIGGGGYDGITTAGNNAQGAASFIGGGLNNQNTSGSYTVIGGGQGNSASSTYAVISGGQSNTSSGYLASILGGYGNMAHGIGSAIVGGGYDGITTAGNNAQGAASFIGGGLNNIAQGDFSAVITGHNNIATGIGSYIGGGQFNRADGDYSVALGQSAIASGTGSFVFADDSTGLLFSSTLDNSFNVRAVNGAQFATAVDGFGNISSGVILPPGGSAWNSVSDKNKKAHHQEVDTIDVLQKVAAMPIETWNYKSQDTSIRHMGPYAQDFYAAFGLGEDPLSISTLDADGVALAAIQGMYTLYMQDKNDHIKDHQEILSLKETIMIMQKQIDLLQQKIDKLSQ